MIAAGLLIGPGGMLTLIFSTLINATGQGQQFPVPGQITYQAPEPGTYMISNEIRGTFNGSFHSSSPNLPGGMNIAVTHDTTGNAVPLHGGMTSSSEIGSTMRESITYFDAPAAGSYTINVSGFTGQRIFHVGPTILGTIMLTIFGSLALMLVGLGLIVGGIILIVVTLSQRSAIRGEVG